ncbi:MAG: hypothetical protein ACYTF6_12890 [Planctomycetota bacterium]|jgi:hypothetical protein
MRIRLCLLLLAAAMAFCCGCGPSWHTGEEEKPLRHSVRQSALVDEDELVIAGGIEPVVAFTDYGFKINDIHDNTGKKLSARRFQMCYAKGLWFIIATDPPAPAAESVTIDISFTSRSGVQQIRQACRIRRPARPDWLVNHMSRGWR